MYILESPKLCSFSVLKCQAVEYDERPRDIDNTDNAIRITRRFELRLSTNSRFEMNFAKKLFSDGSFCFEFTNLLLLTMKTNFRCIELLFC